MTKKRRLCKKMILAFLVIIIVLAGLLVFKLFNEVKSVLVWQNIVKEETKKYGIEEYSDIVLAIIYTESKGRNIDLMQSSESKYGTTNHILSSEESIETGVKHLSQVIKASDQEGCDIWTAVQAYNFGTQYIDYVAENGKKNSLKLAEDYSRDVLAPLLGNKTSKMYRYNYPIALLYNGGKLYEDGGNMFYAQTVKWNLKKIELFNL